MEEVKEAKEEAKELVALTEEEQQIKKWFDRMKMYPVALSNPVRYMAARMAVAYGLDPFLGEIVFIELRKEGRIAGYQPYVTIGGLRRAARRTGEYMGQELSPCTDDERKALKVEEDAHAWKCLVWRKGIDKPYVGYGVFPMLAWDDRAKAPPWRLAQKRAEHAALRAAFDLELQLMEEEPIGEVVEIEADVIEVPAEYREAQRIIEETTQELEEILGEPRAEEAGEESPPEALPLEPESPEEEPEEEPVSESAEDEITMEDLKAYAKKKGIATGIVKQVLEDTGGAIGETLARLKEKKESYED